MWVYTSLAVASGCVAATVTVVITEQRTTLSTVHTRILLSTYRISCNNEQNPSPPIDSI